MAHLAVFADDSQLYIGFMKCDILLGGSIDCVDSLWQGGGGVKNHQK